MIAYKDMPILEQLAMLCGAAEQAGVPASLFGGWQENIRAWILDSQTRDDYCSRNHQTK